MFPSDGFQFVRALVAAGIAYFLVRFLALLGLAIMDGINSIL